MTISTTYAPSTYAGDGSTTSFPITFAYLSKGYNIKVSLKDNSTGVITVQVASTHYNVSGSNVVFVTAPASGKTVLIELNPSYLQQSDYRENGSLPAEALEEDLDQLKLEVQLAKSKADAALILDPVAANTLTSNVIVASNTAGTNAGKFVRFNEAGNGLEIVTLSSTAQLTDIVADTTPQLGGNLDLNGKNITGTGNISTTGNATITGSANTVQLRVKGHTTQTSNIFEVRNSGDGIVFSTDTSGNTYLSGNLTTGFAVNAANSAKAWVNFDGTGTPSIRGAYNVASISDGGVGNWSVNFQNTLIDANYATVVTIGGTASAAFTAWGRLSSGAGAQTTSSVAVAAVGMGTGGNTYTNNDQSIVNVVVFR